MGFVVILIGLVAAGTVVDFVAENDLASSPDRSFALFGGSVTLNQTEVVVGAAVLGALAVLFIASGIRLSRASLRRRRELRGRVRELERRNSELRSRPTAVTTEPERSERETVSRR